MSEAIERRAILEARIEQKLQFSRKPPRSLEMRGRILLPDSVRILSSIVSMSYAGLISGIGLRGNQGDEFEEETYPLTFTPEGETDPKIFNLSICPRTLLVESADDKIRVFLKHLAGFGDTLRNDPLQMKTYRESLSTRLKTSSFEGEWNRVGLLNNSR